MLEFYDYLPVQCPPAEAIAPNNFDCFRLVVSATIINDDFIPLWLSKSYPDECKSKWLSVMSNLNEVKNLLQLPSNRTKIVAQWFLSRDHWLIQHTPSNNKSHHTRRPYKGLNYSTIFQIYSHN